LCSIPSNTPLLSSPLLPFPSPSITSIFYTFSSSPSNHLMTKFTLSKPTRQRPSARPPVRAGIRSFLIRSVFASHSPLPRCYTSTSARRPVHARLCQNHADERCCKQAFEDPRRQAVLREVEPV
jgi:hypothetical protein